MLQDCGTDIVELGHPERCAFLNETDGTVGLKVEAAAPRNGAVDLNGDTLNERKAGQATDVLQAQVRGRRADFQTLKKCCNSLGL